VDLDQGGDLRKNKKNGPKDVDTYAWNEEGAISAAAVTGVSSLIDETTFTSFIGGSLKPEEAHSAYLKYRQDAVDRAMAMLTLGRILDHEAMKRKMATEPSPARVEYIARALMVRAAVIQGKVKTKTTPDGRKIPNEDLNAYSNRTLYEFLRQLVGTKNVRFRVDWTYADGGLDHLLGALRSEPWAPIVVAFKQLPGTWQEFSAQIREKLRGTAIQMDRGPLWQDLVGRNHGLVAWDGMFAVTEQELQRLYELYRDSGFKIHDTTVTFRAVHASDRAMGTLADHFLSEYSTELGARIKAAQDSIAASQPKSGASDAEVAAWKKQAEAQLAVARLFPQSVYDQLCAKYQGDITSSRLSVSMNENFQLTRKGDEALPDASDHSARAEALRAFFDESSPILKSIVPLLRTADESGGLVLAGVGVVSGADYYLDRRDVRVDAFLRAKIQARIRGIVYRDTAYELLARNPLVVDTDTCTDGAWPCIGQLEDTVVGTHKLEPRRMAELLFPENLVPEKAFSASELQGFHERLLPEDGAGRGQVSSTLGHPDLYPRVAEISLQVFGQALQLPNP
ncbi:MAG: hypothetical protein ACXWP5_05375, partial [Bdellovibrionota bacterium]